MSKYTPLWEYISNKNSNILTLTFNEIFNIINIAIDHSFLNYKKELIKYGFTVDKISIKNKMVVFKKIN